MNDLIKRQDALKIAKSAYDGEIPLILVAECIEALPSAEADMSEYADRLWKIAYERGKRETDVVQGKWIDRSEGGRIRIPWWESHKCDQCGYVGSGVWNFCPSCGARMENKE